MKVQQNSFSIVYSPEFVDNHLLHSEGRDTIRFFEVYLSLFYAYDCFVCMKVCLYTKRLCFLWRIEEGIKSPGTGVADGCELLCGSWEQNPGPLAEWVMLLMGEPLLQL